MRLLVRGSNRAGATNTLPIADCRLQKRTQRVPHKVNVCALLYIELYMNEPVETNRVALFRHGTRVLEDISVVDELAKPPVDNTISSRPRRCAFHQSNAEHPQRHYSG